VRAWLSWFFCQRSFNGPSVVNALQDCAVVNPDSERPILYAKALSAELNESSRGPIHGLFIPSSPPAVARSIAGLSIDPINRLVRRAFAHVGEKVLKLEPAFAYRDSFPSVPPVRRSRFSKAAPEHVLPNLVGFGFLASCGIPMRCRSNAGQISQKASARLGITTSQAFASGCYLRSAFAAADPHSFPGFLYSALGYHCETTKCPA
jgi:hypothetical protein